MLNRAVFGSLCHGLSHGRSVAHAERPAAFDRSGDRQLSPERDVDLLGPDRDAGAPGPKGDKGDKGDPGEPATRLWAVMNSNGTIARQSGAVTSAQVLSGAGQYLVTFNRDVRTCAFQATVGASLASMSAWVTPPEGQVNVSFGGAWTSNPGTIVVETSNSAGALTQQGVKPLFKKPVLRSLTGSRKGH